MATQTELGEQHDFCEVCRTPLPLGRALTFMGAKLCGGCWLRALEWQWESAWKQTVNALDASRRNAVKKRRAAQAALRAA